VSGPIIGSEYAVILNSFELLPGLQKVSEKGPVPVKQIGEPTGINGQQSIC